jgi:hypothetical protein
MIRARTDSVEAADGTRNCHPAQTQILIPNSVLPGRVEGVYGERLNERERVTENILEVDKLVSWALG